MKNNLHSFHIPVMGIGYTVDTPIKVAQYGISSVISLVDDTLIEQMRKYYCAQYNKDYSPITKSDNDCRAKRITAYLNLLDEVIDEQFREVKASAFEPASKITTYFEFLDDQSSLKKEYLQMLNESDAQKQRKQQESLRAQMVVGSIDVNIMTKLDRPNYDKDGNDLGPEFSDAMAALRGFALSTVSSAIVFSAGINKRLYTYVEKFEDFYANAAGYIKKKIILKVSDYRSSIIQGRVFAKSGIWISEYRIESGLNCGGHVFPSNGQLLGPILDEFKKKKNDIIDSLKAVYDKAIEKRFNDERLFDYDMRFTVQGGVCTSEEHEFLMNHYGMQAVGWGTPFMLVPEAVAIDPDTVKKLIAATEEDLYVSGASPLNVGFNNLKESDSEQHRRDLIAQGSPGSNCPKGHLSFNTEFTPKPICSASKQYQSLKLAQLKETIENPEELEAAIEKIITKSCICHDLGTAALKLHSIGNMKTHFPAVCPGPTLAYFSKLTTLKEMIAHIYGRINLCANVVKPHMFIKEAKMYIDKFVRDCKDCSLTPSAKQIKTINEFLHNLTASIEYYNGLFPQILTLSKDMRDKALAELKTFQSQLEELVSLHSFLSFQ